MVAIERSDGAVDLRQYDYDDGRVLAADLGPGTDAAVDVADGTVIVVVDGEQHEVEAPGEDARAFIRNGVLTVEVDG
jgi:hypothetical protein